MYHKQGSWGSGGEDPGCWAIFVSFWDKKLFQSHWITYRSCVKPFERTGLLIFQSQSKKLNWSILFLLAIKVQNTLR